MKLSNKILLSTIAVWFLLVFCSGIYVGGWVEDNMENKIHFHMN